MGDKKSEIKLGPGTLYIKSNNDELPLYFGRVVGGKVVNNPPNVRQKVKRWLQRAIYHFRR